MPPQPLPNNRPGKAFWGNDPAARLVRVVVIICVVLIVSLWGFIAVDLRHEREIHVAQAQRDNENLAIAFENHVENTITGIDALLVSLRQALLDHHDLSQQSALVEWAHNGPLKDSIVQIGVIDRNGFLTYTSANRSIRPIFVGDRDHFRAHVGTAGDKLFISKPIRVRTTDLELIPFSRRVSGADGSFQGVVSVLVRAEHFSRFFQSIRMGSQGAVTLVHSGVVVARASATAPPANPIGLDISAVLPGPGIMADTRVIVSPVDGLTRLIHFRRLKDQPLAVIVSQVEEDYLTEYRGTVLHYWIIGLMASFCLLGFALLLVHLVRRLAIAGQQVATSEARLRGIVENINVATWELDLASWRFTYVSPQVETMFGYPAGDWLQENFWPEHLHADDRESALAFCVTQTEQLADHNFEYRFIKQDGSVAWVRDIVKVITDNRTSPIRLTGVMIDITQEKKVAAELANQHALLRKLIDSVPDLIFFKDLNSVYIGCNQAFAEYAGHLESELIGKTDLDFFDQETAGAFRDRDREMLDSGDCRRNEEWVNYPDGRAVLLDTLKAPFLGGQGEALGLIGISRDITESKRAEEGLLLARSVLESTNEGIMVTDAEARILMVNPAFVAITGWRADEVIGARPSLLRSGRHPPEFYAEIWQAVRSNGHWEGEIWNRRKDGAIFVEWMTINAMRDAGDVVTRYVALFSDITLRKNREELVWRQANFDALTGLANRNLFHDRLDRALVSARRKQQQVGLMFIDLDRFKWVNDTLGHEAGDCLLVETAARLLACVREEDTVARMGGDEFTIVLQGLSDQGQVQDVALKVLAALAQPFMLNGSPQHLSGSVGVTIFPNDADNTGELLRNADIAMYQAKAAGRNRYQFYSADMQQDALARLQLEQELRCAITEDGFVLHYQPIVDCESRVVHGVEALLRWRHPVRGLLAAADFLAVAENCALSVSLGEWVIGDVCRQWRAWVDAGYAPLRIAINVSKMHLHHASLLDCIKDAMTRYAVPGSMLSLDLTEAPMLGQGDEHGRLLRDLKSLGLHLSLDDFGSGYSSLTVLKGFPFDTVKIDGSFITHLPASVEDQQLVESIVFMAHRFNLQVVAEGVESEAQLAFLRQAGCDLAQGFLIGKPLPAEGLIDFLKHHPNVVT